MIALPLPFAAEIWYDGCGTNPSCDTASAEKRSVARLIAFLKRLFITGGVEREAFDDVRGELVDRNRRTLLYASATCVILFLGMFVSAFAGTDSATLGALRLRSRTLYLSITLLCVLVVLAAKLLLPSRRRLVLPACYLFLGILFASAIWISTFNQPYYPGTTFCVFLVVLPMLIIDRPYRLMMYVTAVCAVYLLCSYASKTWELFTIDVLNCFCFFYLSLTVGLLVQNLRINEVVQRKAVERQRDLDDLTGLLSRAAFERDARSAIARGEVTAMLFLDIDGFKLINDTHGHVYGDAVLRTVAACIRDALPEDTLSGRFGGDEFILCLTRAGDSAGGIGCAQALQRAIRQDVILPGGTGALTVSIGICAEAGLSYDDMLLRADRAAYRAKQRGKDQCCAIGE